MNDNNKVALAKPKTYEAPVVKKNHMKKKTRIIASFMIWLKVAGDGI
jgi:hypothetical protein